MTDTAPSLLLVVAVVALAVALAVSALIAFLAVGSTARRLRRLADDITKRLESFRWWN